ncbi:MAG: malto-oligosyltrehalose synthase, partial [Gemmataceae bacterium]
RIEKIYSDFIGESIHFEPLVQSCKKMIMQVAMASEINSLSHQLDRLAERNRRYRDFTLNTLSDALRDVIACLGVYRTYTTSNGVVSEPDREILEAATEEARRRNPRTAHAVFDFLRDTLLLRNLDQFAPEHRAGLLEWVLRFQQLTGPIMAKGIEDTAFYVYNRLVSLNEVGGHPQRFGVSVQAFHEQNQLRAERWPSAMISTSTHDTKRGEDVRVRISVLSELPHEWECRLAEWRQLNDGLIGLVDGQPAPSANDVYLFFQTLLGVWPDTPPNQMTLPALQQRLTEYMVKSIREAKQHTSWINSNESYEQAVCRYVEGVLSEPEESPFRKSFERFHQRLAFFGRINALVQMLVKLTSPGVPDIYQGTELWDLTLVDPDNRRPVDFEFRKNLLAELLVDPDLELMMASLENGHMKMYLTVTLLQLRKRRPDLFERGEYQPIMPVGEQADNMCAYLRGGPQRKAMVIGCIRPVAATRGEEIFPTGEIWGDTFLPWPGLPVGTLVQNLFTGEDIELIEKNGMIGVLASESMRYLPFSVLLSP